MAERKLLFYLSLLVAAIPTARGHGYLQNPPSRSSVWREYIGKTLPPGVVINYNDNELYCGGFSHQWSIHGGKCGICGDPYEGPRENEAGGKYAGGFISRTYQQGQVIDVEVKLTVDHKGWFEFRLCPHNNPTVPATQECLDQHLLMQPNGDTRYTWSTSQPTVHYVKLQLPATVTCSQCVVQWKYHAGNNWGCDTLSGPCGIGKGPQEEFYGCADVSISSTGMSPTPTNSGSTEAPTSTTSSEASSTTSIKTTTTSGPQSTSTPTVTTTVKNDSTTESISTISSGPQSTITPIVTTTVKKGSTTDSASTISSDPQSTSIPIVTTTMKKDSTNKPGSSCVGVPPWKETPGIDKWCVDNCNRGYCPASHCKCNQDTTSGSKEPSTLSKLLVSSTTSSTGQTSSTTSTSRTTPTAVYETESSTASSSTTTGSQGSSCVGVPPWKETPGIDKWCVDNCNRGYCPASHCKCNQDNTSGSKEPSTLSKLLISSTTSSAGQTSSTTSTSRTTPTAVYETESSTASSSTTTGSQDCRFFKSVGNLGPIIDNYCNICSREGSCPDDFCTCDTSLPELHCLPASPDLAGFCTYFCTYNQLVCPDTCGCTVIR